MTNKTKRGGGPEEKAEFEVKLASAPSDPVVADVAPRCIANICGHLPDERVMIEVPLGPVGDDCKPRHIDVQLRTPQQREAMRRIFRGLDLTGARSADGRRVTNTAEAVRWLIEQVAEAADNMQNPES